MPLRHQLQISSDGNPVYVNIPWLQTWEYYWESSEKQYELWQLLGDSIINQPYADDSYLRSRIRTIGSTVYRPNHGTVHSIRQLIYVENFFKLIKTNGKQKFKKLAMDQALKKTALMQLSAFLCRSGRTNEHKHSDDHTYGDRSANIFELVAAKLKFKQSDFAKFSGYIKDYVPNKDAERKLGYTDEDRLYKNLIDMVHHVDLIRCHKKSDVHYYVFETLRSLVEGSEKEHANWTVATIALVESVCLKTGTKISSDALSEKTYDDKLFTHCTHQVGDTINELRFLSIGGSDSVNQLKSAAFSLNPLLAIKGPDAWNKITESENNCLICHCHVSIGHRHHCRICGNGHFCDNCAPKRKVIIKKATLFERVCADCFDMNFSTGTGVSENKPSYWASTNHAVNDDDIVRNEWYLTDDDGVVPKQMNGGTHFFNVPKEHEVFKKISAYINENIKARGYSSAKGEDARMNTAEWAVNPANKEATEFQIAMAERRLTERRGKIDPAKSQVVTVRSVRLIINPDVWNRYNNFREEILKQLAPKGGSEVDKIRWTNSIGKLSQGFTLPVLDKSIGETLLFHGTAAKWIELIIQGGFNPSVGKNYGTATNPRYGMLGQGTYLTDSFAKMMTYGSCPLCGDFACNCRSIKTRKKLTRSCILARVTLGKIDHYTSKALSKVPGFSGEAQRFRGQAFDTDTLTHSVVAHGLAPNYNNLLTFGGGRNEMMSKVMPQTYPEFVVDYVLGDDDEAPLFYTVINEALNRYQGRWLKSPSAVSTNAVRILREIINSSLDDNAKNEKLSNYVLYYLDIKKKIEDPKIGSPVGRSGDLYKHIVTDLQKYGFLPLA
ncbi:SidE phosphodiesterase domain-containing protein [Methylobacter psychrophilus]|uniref:SidE phosphodiesterase domain-containing protein n=1 Tax=Methylobacter psychrophilus TaxID=96941 RepID=UPI0021D4ADF1|nr:SidE phosphodiesterase domain-containing protein [Methylobacter psychrophilus]